MTSGKCAYLPRGRKRTTAVLMLLATAAIVGRADEPVQLTDTWSGGETAGWTNGGGGVTRLSVPAEALNVQSVAQIGAPVFAADVVRRPLPATIMPTNIAFRFRSGTLPPSELRACFHAARANRTWYRALAPPAAGETLSYRVPVAFADGWFVGPNSSGSDFADDLRDVDWLGVYLVRHGSPEAQDATLDDFTVSGLVWSGDDDMDGVPNPWEVSHGFNAADWRDAWLDADGDGMSNYGEYRAGTDPTNRLSMLAVNIRVAGKRPPTNAVPIVLTWQSVSNRTYTVLRAADPLREFHPVATAVPATPPENAYHDEGAPAAVYRIRVD